MFKPTNKYGSGTYKPVHSDLAAKRKELHNQRIRAKRALLEDKGKSMNKAIINAIYKSK